MLLGIMLKRVQAQTQQVSMSGNFALDFASLVKLAINTSKRCQKFVFVAAQEVGFDNLCEIVDGRHDDQQHARNGFPFLVNSNPKNYSGGSLSRQNEEFMKQYVSRRRRCLTLLVQMDPVIHLSEGHRSNMLLDLSGFDT